MFDQCRYPVPFEDAVVAARPSQSQSLHGVGRQGQRDNLCRPCRSAYGREHYEANRQRYIDQAAKLKRKVLRDRTVYLIEHFETHPCVDCGEADPIVLEFDHIRDKRFTIGAAIHDRGWQSVLDEIAKCEVVCANCHRRRTASRRRALRARLRQARAEERAMGIEPTMGAWKAPVLPTTPRPLGGPIIGSLLGRRNGT
jgi:hypothetical protein